MHSLSILIPTVPERRKEFTELWNELVKQAEPFGEHVQLIPHGAPRKIMSIGEKRQALKGWAETTHVVYFDDDDLPHPHYVSDIMGALEHDPDCVGCVIDMTIDGAPHNQCVHSLQFKRWSNGPKPTPGMGNVYQRNVTHRNPVRTSIAQEVAFPDLRFGEDQVWSDQVTAKCKSEYFIARPGFVYRYSSKEKHNEKYGIQV